jgi:predicted amidohydrolase YtcJ
MDCILFNGNLLTQDRAVTGSAVAIANGRIIAVGDDRSLCSLAQPHTSLIDLDGKTLLPGFEDAHAHIWKIGHLLTTMVDLRACGSFDDLADLLREREGALYEGAWLQGRGFNEAKLAERRRPTREDLDRWVPDRPVILTRTCGHVFVANSVALQLAGIGRHTNDPVGGVIERDATGEPNGILHETAIGLIHHVLPPPTAEAYEAMILSALRHQASHGITASSDCGVLPALLDVYVDLDRRGDLPGRMVVMPLGRPDGTSGLLRLPTQHHSPFLQVDTVKFLADGGLSGSTAALSVPYRDTASRGVLRFPLDDLRELFEQAQEADWRIATHAIGDVAIEQVLTLIERLTPSAADRAHRIEHLGIPTMAHLQRAASLNVMTATQSIFLRELGTNFLHVLPDALLPQLYPFRSMLDSGMTMALSSDAPVVEQDSPLAGMHAAITRRTSDGRQLSPEQALTAEQALAAYTLAGATLAGQGKVRGSISVGKVADFVLLSADPVKIPTEDLLQVSIVFTMVNGKIVYQQQS